jgi:pyridoxamine 5'-phosphate oxidase
MKIDVAELRENYTRGGLREEDLEENPVDLFRRWMEEAVNSEVDEPNAMSLATIADDGTPNNRIVLLKGIGDRYIRFFTNYKSTKGKDLDANPVAAVSFWWPELERQVRIKGRVEKISREESDGYFQSRPRESKLGAWASEQSSQVKNREELQQSYEAVEKKFKNTTIPTPEFWGGFQINITEIEFWQGRPSRLHDRFLYTYQNGNWSYKRLQP